MASYSVRLWSRNKTKVVWLFLEVFWFSKGNTTRHSEQKKEEVDRRRGGKTLIKSRQGCALPADLGLLKQDRLKRVCCEVICGTRIDIVFIRRML